MSTWGDDPTADRCPHRVRGLEQRSLGDGLTVFDAQSGAIHSMNATGEFVWGRCDGRAPVADIIVAFADAFGLPTDVAARDVRTYLTQLEAAGLIGTKDIVLPAEGPSRSTSAAGG